ncbi:hypothetical protein PCBGKBDD_00061 [Escherichia phage vB_EcoS-12469I]|nr:hypothetical protein H1N77_gp64 [Escherichia phage vB_EcoS-12210I]QDJ97973.1 hypothetical protein EPENGAHN_00004 [Escherichia phage vB_EcoS-12210III]QDJ98062.1 hypothetical protein LNEMGHCG_00030 [Escherichia phage vB_EcoS-12397I]QDJ98110.1 hypothetical protein AKDFDEBO_00012 [Escherichia phage vB_EcoS-12397II]QDJ98228.1 hypothetical protein BFFAFCJP_00065 [Escherichia phage vB_EcoS-12397III]QDJ98356.1 hypothetical protein PCBGKBDD_00061 [Escherichia phage vB_EcoS-12469I]QDJ98398.1 hypothe
MNNKSNEVTKVKSHIAENNYDESLGLGLGLNSRKVVVNGITGFHSRCVIAKPVIGFESRCVFVGGVL